MNLGRTSPEQLPIRWQWLRELTFHYFHELERHGQRPLWTDENLQTMFLTLVLCDALGQLRFIPGGFYGWIRMSLEHLETVGYSRDLHAIVSLGREELTTGPVVFVAEVLAETPKQAYKAMRELRRLPGLTHWAAWRDCTRHAGGKIHGR